MDLDIPFIIGHRGASGEAPEDTVAAVMRAHDLGCRWVEIDVQLSADGVPMVIHDHTLARTTNGCGPVRAMTAHDLTALDAGSWFAPAFSDQRVPTLATMLQTCRDLDLGLNIELKPSPGADEETARAVAAAVKARVPSLLVSSFSHLALAAFHGTAPDIALGALFKAPPNEDQLQALGLPLYSVHVGAQTLRHADVVRLLAAGYRVLSYTVNDPEQAQRLKDWGVTAIFTDFPGRFADHDAR